MTNELEPCPFCPGGGDPNHFGGAGHHCVKCSKCGRTNERLVWTESDGWHYEAFDTSEEAADDWNTRYKRTCHGVKNESKPKDQWVRCSECNCELWWQDPTTSEHVINFCSNCGAEVVDG